MAVAPALMIIGTIVSAGAAVMGAVAAKNQADFQSDVAKQNAKIAQQRAAAEAARIRRDNQRRIGSQTTGFGAAGVTIEGSAADALDQSTMIGEEDAQLALFGGSLDARQQSINAKAAKSSGNAALVGGLGRAGGTALTGAATFAKEF